MKKLTVLFLFVAVSVAANAYVLHWDDYKSIVAPGTVQYDYLNVDGSGIDIRVDWINAANMQTGYPTNDIDGLGMGSGHWFVNASAGMTVVLISFSEPVPYCKLDFWEIDGEMAGDPSLTNYIDKIRIKGWDTPYSVTGLDASHYIAPSDYDGGSDVMFIEVAGDASADSGLNIINGGLIDDYDANPENHAWVEFADPVFHSFAFVFSSGQPSRGAVLGDIVFVPEPATLVLLGFGAFISLKRRR